MARPLQYSLFGRSPPLTVGGDGDTLLPDQLRFESLDYIAFGPRFP